jgi:hypothetical protein
MEISSASSGTEAGEVQQALLLKKALKLEQAQQLALIESTQAPVPADAASGDSPVGRYLNVKV